MNNQGTLFEKLIATICVKYAGQGFMRVKKVDPPTKNFGKFMVQLQNPFLDFVGSWTEKGGRAIFFEAKHTKKGRLPLGDGGLTDKQRDAMRLWQGAGAVVFLIWEYDGRCALFRHQDVERLATLARSLRHEDGILVPAGLGHAIYDFRMTMLELWP